MTFARAFVATLLMALATSGSSAATPIAEASVSKGSLNIEALLFPTVDLEGLRAQGAGVLPSMARLYERSDEQHRATIAYAFYGLGWKSPDAKRVLLADIHTPNQDLRLQVQWALGRVSGDLDVVDALLANMQHDTNPLFRDKAACALAHDQIHLTEVQKVHLYEHLIRALRDPKPDVRAIASLVLEIQTGQRKGFDANATLAAREAVVKTWERWLETYRANL